MIFMVLLLAAHAAGVVAQGIIKPSLGFACYEGGSATKQVKAFSTLVLERDYSKIMRLLNSKESADKFLCVIALEKLQKLKKVKLSKSISQELINVRNSNELVSVCSGCTYFEVLSLKDLFLNKGEIYNEAEFWINELLSVNTK